MPRSVLSLATLATAVEGISTTVVDEYFETNYYGTGAPDTKRTMGEIYDQITAIGTDVTAAGNKLGLAINNVETATMDDINTTYGSLNALAMRLGTIDTLLDLSTVDDEGKTALDSIQELSAWIVAHESEIADVASNYIEKGVIKAASVTFTSLTDDADGLLGTYDVVFGAALANANYRVVITPVDADTTGAIGEYCVFNKTTAGFTVGFTGDPVGKTFTYVVVPDTLNFVQA